MRKIKISIIVFLIIICSSTYVFSKYEINKKIQIASIQIDSTPPILQVDYSTIELTKEDVIVTIISNEEIESVDGFSLSDNKMKLTKTYSENTEEDIEVKDISGNISNVKILIDNIDKEEPQIKIEYVRGAPNTPPTVIDNSSKIYFKITVTDDCQIANQLELENINILVGNRYPTCEKISLGNNIQTKTKRIYNLILDKIYTEGNLIIKIPEGVIKDKVGHESNYIEFDTGIKVENH